MTRPNPHPTHLEAVAHAAASVVKERDASMSHNSPVSASKVTSGVPVPDGSREAAVGSRGRHITIDIPAPYFPPVRDRKTKKLKPVGPFINSNMRLHRHQEAKMTKAWRETAALRAHGIPQFAGQVHIIAHIFKPRAGRWDPNNLWPTIKAAVDGCVDAGLLADDDHLHVIGPDMRSAGTGNPEIVLEIIELPREKA